MTPANTGVRKTSDLPQTSNTAREQSSVPTQIYFASPQRHAPARRNTPLDAPTHRGEKAEKRQACHSHPAPPRLGTNFANALKTQEKVLAKGTGNAAPERQAAMVD
jgi:hypothetical protein